MKKLIFSVLAIAALVVTPMSSFAADPTALATANGSASIISPINISKTADLDFGIISGIAAGTVTIAATSGAQLNPVITGDLSVISTSTSKAAAFSVTGSGNATYAIVMNPSLTLTGTGTAVGKTMTSTLVLDAAKTGAVGTLAGGADNIYVGGVLTVAAAQTAGPYAGTFNVTINYN